MLYAVTGIEQLEDRYAYVVAAPLVLLTAFLLATPLAKAARGAMWTAIGAKLALAAILLVWLPSAPLLGLDPTWLRRQASADAYLEQFDQLVAALPEGTTVNLENVPQQLFFRSNMKSWIDLKWSAKQIKLGNQTVLNKLRGQPLLALSPLDASGAVQIQATYHSTED